MKNSQKISRASANPLSNLVNLQIPNLSKKKLKFSPYRTSDWQLRGGIW